MRVARLLDAGAARNAGERRLIEALAAAGGSLDTTALKRRLGRPADAALRSLSASGAVLIEERMQAPTTKALVAAYPEMEKVFRKY